MSGNSLIEIENLNECPSCNLPTHILRIEKTYLPNEKPYLKIWFTHDRMEYEQSPEVCECMEECGGYRVMIPLSQYVDLISQKWFQGNTMKVNIKISENNVNFGELKEGKFYLAAFKRNGEHCIVLVVSKTREEVIILSKNTNQPTRLSIMALYKICNVVKEITDDVLISYQEDLVSGE